MKTRRDIAAKIADCLRMWFELSIAAAEIALKIASVNSSVDGTYKII